MPEKKDNLIKKVITGRGLAEITEKKSRFIAHAAEIHSEAEAVSFIEEIKKEYWDAKHNCYAYVVGGNNEIQRFSDDKEPQGTAGKPILEVLLANNVRNTIIVVTRYFGGFLLGTGGLVRAYSSAASEALKASDLRILSECAEARILCDYNSFGKVKYILEQFSSDTKDLCISDIEYSDNVVFHIVSGLASYDMICKKITEATNAKALITGTREASYAVKDGCFTRYSLSQPSSL